jgi:hypothetical protein
VTFTGPTGAAVVAGVVVAGAVVVVVVAAAIAKVTVAVAVPAVAPVAVTVTDADDAALGVPLITPVDELIAKPAGKVPLVTA